MTSFWKTFATETIIWCKNANLGAQRLIFRGALKFESGKADVKSVFHRKMCSKYLGKFKKKRKSLRFLTGERETRKCRVQVDPPLRT